jgi:RecA-family ATPase
MNAFDNDPLPPAWDETPLEHETKTKSGSACAWPPPLDLALLATTSLTPPQFIIPDWMPCGYATMLAGHGGAGKSYIALALAVHIAAGIPWCGFNVRRCRVQYLSCEDRVSVLHWRLRHICDHLGLDMAELVGWLDVRDLVGHDAIVWQPDEPPFTTATYDVLAEQFRQSGAHLLVIDGITDAFGGDENSRWQVKSFVNSLLALIDPDDGALLLQAHVNKLTTIGHNATPEGYSGSTAWHNAVRARWYLHPETDQDEDNKAIKTGALKLDLQKSNLGRADQSLTFRWHETDRLFVGEAPVGGALNAALAANREREERESILAAIGAVIERGDYVPAATTGPRTAYHVLSASGKLAGSLLGEKANKKRFWRHVEHLRSMRQIREGSIRRPCGHKTNTLELETQ